MRKASQVRTATAKDQQPIALSANSTGGKCGHVACGSRFNWVQVPEFAGFLPIHIVPAEHLKFDSGPEQALFLR